jgi:hypothetical protein
VRTRFARGNRSKRCDLNLSSSREAQVSRLPLSTDAGGEERFVPGRPALRDVCSPPDGVEEVPVEEAQESLSPGGGGVVRGIDRLIWSENGQHRI